MISKCLFWLRKVANSLSNLLFEDYRLNTVCLGSSFAFPLSTRHFRLLIAFSSWSLRDSCSSYKLVMFVKYDEKKGLGSSCPGRSSHWCEFESICFINSTTVSFSFLDWGLRNSKGLAWKYLWMKYCWWNRCKSHLRHTLLSPLVISGVNSERTLRSRLQLKVIVSIWG